jgi:predicted nuclease of predicted toxin-antitoxin system
MKFLADVNASGSLARWLISRNHDVVMVSEKNPRMTDEEILSWAVSENRIIVTTDKDFEEMIWRQAKPHCGLLRLENLPRRERLELIRDALACHIKDLEAGAIVIASKTKFRVRKLR